MQVQEFGAGHSIALIGVPGLLGGPGDFRDLIPEFSKHFHFMILDPTADKHKSFSLNKLPAAVVEEVSFDSTAEDVLEVMHRFGHKQAYLMGVSLGGKVVFDFAIKHPEAFLGGFITDVGPGSFETSDLYQLVDQIVRYTDLNRTWSEVKQDFLQRIPDRKLRSLIQSQVAYPEQKPPGVWKTAMQNFGAMLGRQEIDLQFENLEAADQSLVAQGRYFHIFHASHDSGIAHADLRRVQALQCVKMIEVSESNHFLHISHKELLERTVLERVLNLG